MDPSSSTASQSMAEKAAPSSPVSTLPPKSPTMELASYATHRASHSAPALHSPPIAPVDDAQSHRIVTHSINTYEDLTTDRRSPVSPISPLSTTSRRPHPTTPRPQALPNNAPARRRAGVQDRQHRSLYRTVREFLGHGNPARRRIVHAYSRLAFGLLQVVITAAFVGLSRSTWRSPRPRDNGISEWTACDKPLGALAIVWTVRAAIGMLLTTWSFIRSRPQPEEDVEGRQTDTRRRSRRVTTAQPAISGNTNPRQAPAVGAGLQPNTANPPARISEWDGLYDKISNLVSLLVIAHFLTTNVLLFSSTGTCRVSSPHLWWLSFAILCLTYIIILEVLLICATVFVIVPIIFVGLNVVLVCTGHRPIGPRRLIDPGHINPETPKMPQKLVDKIPLVLYIPVPTPSIPEPSAQISLDKPADSSHDIEHEVKLKPDEEIDSSETIQPPEKAHTYPPRAHDIDTDTNSVPSSPMTRPELPRIRVTNTSTSSFSSAHEPKMWERPALSIAGPSTAVPSVTSSNVNASVDPNNSSSLSINHTVLTTTTRVWVERPQKPAKTARFAFFRRKSNASELADQMPQSNDQIPVGIQARPRSDEEVNADWEDNWEKSELPFVQLEGNRAACAICLMDFDEPPKKKKADEAPGNLAPQSKEEEGGTLGEGTATITPKQDKEDTKKKKKEKQGKKTSRDSPEAAAPEQNSTDPEPLRLLQCGHVFHKSCLDPWLTGVSGRCPTCQREVVIEGRKHRD